MSDADREMLDLALLLGLNLLNAAGLRLMRPEQSRLAGQVLAILAQGAVGSVRV